MTPHRKQRVRLAVALVCGLLFVGVLVWILQPRATTPREAMAKGHYKLAGVQYAEEAAAGDPRAQTALANLHYLGLGVRRDYRRAAELYYAAASKGYSPAQMNLGHLYKQGLGVQIDRLRAFGWYNMANIHNDPSAEYYLKQISLEYTLSPLQQSTAASRWDRLDRLVAEGL